MAHVIVLYHVICFSVGIGSLILFFFIYHRYRMDVMRYYLYLNILLTVHISLNAFNIYRRIIMQDQNMFLYVIVSTLFLVWFSFLFYVLPRFFHNLVDVPVKGFRKMFFTGLFVVSFLLSYVSLFVKSDLAEKYQLNQFLLNKVNIYVLVGMVIYLLGLVVFNLKKIQNKEAIKILKTILVLIIIFVPGFVADADYFAHSYDTIRSMKRVLPYGFTFSALFYLAWNVSSLIFALRYLLSDSKDYSVNLLQISTVEVSPLFLMKYKITGREKEVLMLLLEGYSNKEICEKLYLSMGTVKNHVSNIYNKTGVNHRLDLASLIRKSL